MLRPRWKRQKSQWGLWLIIIVLCFLVLGASLDYVFPALGCDIKGNISRSGERIYHLPNQKFYSKTRINWLRGERYFCSESAALQAGWRRSKI